MVGASDFCRRVGTVLAAVAMLAAGAAAVAAPLGNAAWGSGTYTGTSVSEPLPDVLQRIGSLAGIGVEVSSAVQEQADEVTRSFQNEPLQAAFESLLRAYNLKAEFLPQSNRISVDVQGQAPTLVVVAPSSIPLARVERALRHYGLYDSARTGVRVVTDRSTGSVMLEGDPAGVRNISQFIGTLDSAHKARLDEAKQREEEAAARKRRQIEQSLLQQRLAQKVEVEIFKLRYASVAPTTISVRGQTVQVPGVDETLRTLLGLEDGEQQSSLRDAQTIQVLSGADGLGSGSLLTDLGQLPGKPRTSISIDQRTNSVIVRGDGETIAFVRKILKEIDKEVPLIDIEVMILQAEAGTARNLGVQWAVASTENNNFFPGFSTGNSAGRDVIQLADEANQNNATRTTNIAQGGTANIATNTRAALNPITLLPIAGLETAVASFIFNGSSSFISAQVNLLAAENKAQVLSTPHVVTLNNVPASIEDTSVVHLRVATPEGGEGNIREVDAGLKLNITPSVIDAERRGDEPLVSLSIDAENSTFTESPLGEVSTQEKQIQTQVVLKDKSTFVMGGLFQTLRRENEDGIPGLKDVPLVGFLFRDQASDDGRQETIFFITPNVLNQADIRGQSIEGGLVRDYSRGQQDRLTRERRGLERSSQLINLQRLALEEDE